MSFFETSQRFTIENNIIIGEKKYINVNFKNPGQFLLDAIKEDPCRIAQVDVETNKETTFGELHEGILRCAIWLQNQGAKQGDLITIVSSQNQIDAYLPTIATYLVGAVLNPWYNDLTPDATAYFMKLIRPKFVFAQESVVELVAEAANKEGVDLQIIVFGKHLRATSLSEILSKATDEELRTFQSVEIENLKWTSSIYFSSGTTGFPKAIELSYYFFNYVLGILPVYKAGKQVAMWYSGLNWLSGWYNVISTLALRTTRITHSEFDPEETCQALEKYKVNWTFLSPTQLIYLCRSGVLDRYKLLFLQKLSTGGAKLQPEIFDILKKKLPHVNIGQGYGMSEIGVAVSYTSEACIRMDSSGFVCPNVLIKVIDLTTKKALGPNEPGEICVKVPTMMTGYYNNPEATKNAIDEQGWYHSGDIGFYLENGELVISDRLKEIMKFRGHHVSPYELEELLQRHPSVLEAVVVPLPHDLDIERPMAFVTVAPGSNVTEQELIDISASLGNYKKLWGGVQFVDRLPYTASGKIDRKEARKMAKDLAAMKQKINNNN